MASQDSQLIAIQDKIEHGVPPGQIKHTNSSNLYTANRRGGQTSLRRGPQVTYRENPPPSIIIKICWYQPGQDADTNVSNGTFENNAKARHPRFVEEEMSCGTAWERVTTLIGIS
ncbi:hypothetical protein N7486_009904 [Penicillium sp. IBT 16267x]|nr:hypothetical protein N7486_009904 [Penicillium sp. IBT 16267x]